MRDRAVRFSEYIMGKNVAVGSNALGSSDQNSRFAATSLGAAGVNLNVRYTRWSCTKVEKGVCETSNLYLDISWELQERCIGSQHVHEDIAWV